MSKVPYQKYSLGLPTVIRQEAGGTDYEVRHDRAIKKSFTDDDVVIAHSDNPAYWNRRHATEDSEFGYVAQLHTVAWLELSFEMRGVPGGRHLAYVRMLCGDRRRFNGNWRVGVGCREISQFVPDAAKDKSEAVAFIPERGLSLPIGRWVYVIIGVIQVAAGDTVQFHFLGGNPSWTGPMQFDHGGLIPLRIGWEIKRLLLLGMISKTSGDSAPCPLRLLNPDLVLFILQFL